MRIIEKGLWFLCAALLLCAALAHFSDTRAQALILGRRDVIRQASGLSRGEISAAPLPAVTTASSAAFSPVPQPFVAAINNKTPYHIDAAALSAPTFSLTPGKTAVLIVHTHGSEAYTPDEEYPYTPTDTDRTNDPERNMIRTGRALAALLNAQGIVTLHDETLHDEPSYSGSYARSLQTVEGYLARHPSIQLVIDLHRDAFLYEDGTRLRSVCRVDGETAAQIMLVVGTDAGGLSHPDWEDNLGTAAALQQALEALNPGITKAIDLRQERFNQHVSAGALIVELGASGNTLGEALRSVPVLAEAIAQVLSSI